jgi:hypothetical protein
MGGRPGIKGIAFESNIFIQRVAGTSVDFEIIQC